MEDSRLLGRKSTESEGLRVLGTGKGVWGGGLLARDRGCIVSAGLCMRPGAGERPSLPPPNPPFQRSTMRPALPHTLRPWGLGWLLRNGLV